MNYSKLDKHIASLGPFQDCDNLIEKLRKGHEDDSVDDGYEFIVENQRGSMFFGISLFTKNSLMHPLDPPHLQTLQGDEVKTSELYPLPGLDWEWSWSQWHVLMFGDVDYEGWAYGKIRFQSKHWKGVYSVDCFVRRRIWVRKRARLTNDMSEECENVLSTKSKLRKKVFSQKWRGKFWKRKAIQAGEIDFERIAKQTTCDESEKQDKAQEFTLKEFLSYLKGLHLDRLRCQCLLVALFEEFDDQILQQVMDDPIRVLGVFDYATSKTNFFNKFGKKLSESHSEILERVLQEMQSVVY